MDVLLRILIVVKRSRGKKSQRFSGVAPPRLFPCLQRKNIKLNHSNRSNLESCDVLIEQHLPKTERVLSTVE
jgi:hypothetical protein